MQFRIMLLFLALLYRPVLSGYSVDIKVNSSDVSLSEITGLDGQTYQNISLKDFGHIWTKGAPNLPSKGYSFIIPRDQEVVAVDVNVRQSQLISLEHPIVPSYPETDLEMSSSGTKMTLDTSIYRSSSEYPAQVAVQVADGYFDGDNHIVNIRVCPFRYSPLNNHLELITSFGISLRLKSSSHTTYMKPAKRQDNADLIYDRMLKQIVVNTENIDACKTERITGLRKQAGTVPFYEYVVITSNALSSSFNEFVKWKQQQGYNIGIVTLETLASYSGDEVSNLNDMPGKIRKYLRDGYNAGKTVWVLIGGDASVVPVRYGTAQSNTYAFEDCKEEYGKIPSDLYYASLDENWNHDNDAYYGEPNAISDGEDIQGYPELFVGRILCRSGQAGMSDIANWTSLLKRYESAYETGNIDLSYVNKAMLLETDQYQDLAHSGTTIRDFLVSKNFSVKLFQEMADGKPCGSCPIVNSVVDPDPNTVMAEMDKGYGIVGLFTHSSGTSFDTRTSANPETQNADGTYQLYRYPPYYT